jgi:hypothetical protein
LDPEQRAKFDNFLAAFAALQALRFHLSGALVTRAPKPQLPPETRNYMDAYVVRACVRACVRVRGRARRSRPRSRRARAATRGRRSVW